MSTLLGLFADGTKVANIKTTYKNTCYPRNILKPKKYFNCKQAHNRKLRKYKLRKDGKEDEDVSDVCQNILYKLNIKSPNQKEYISLDNKNRENYLSIMARRKLKTNPEVIDVKEKKANDSDIANVLSINESQEKKTTNAFKLMMDSRNKSIGTNSPGKEKNIDSAEKQEISEKKYVKAKRQLALEKLAESKGSLKKKNIEEQHEKCIERKMEKRAERLKSMIMKNKDKETNEHTAKKVDKDAKVPAVIATSSMDRGKLSKKLELVNIFNDVRDSKNCDKISIKNILKEDEEFLKKLSPSMKKKENMLSYFQKIDKKSDLDSPKIQDNGIKIKVNSKRKSKLKKLSLKKDRVNEDLKNHDENNSSNINTGSLELATEGVTCSSNNNERRKRKRKEHTVNIPNSKTHSHNSIQPTDIDNGRPKRQVKRPIKYIYDFKLSSSDEELHIFTPKKRKQIENGDIPAIDQRSDNIVNISDEESRNVNKSKIKREKEIKTQNKPTKLAPIFATKPQPNPEDIEAKRQFLYSGVPDQLKKIIAQQKILHTGHGDDFHVVVHVHQNEITAVSNQSLFDFCEVDGHQNIRLEDNKGSISEFLSLTKQQRSNSVILVNKSNTAVLKTLKEFYPKFPVYRTYRFLKGKSRGEIQDFPNLENSIEVVSGMPDVVNRMPDIVNENPEHINWTDKYKAMSTNNLVGNFQTIKDLRNWLISWTENEMKPRNSATGSDSSDFYESDVDSTDSIKSTNNLLILTGPVGSGKTSSVYAVAADLAIKVIEVNASCKRTGKVMLQDLQEATQSHKVNRGNASTENSQKSQEILENFIPEKIKKKGRPKKVTLSSTKISGNIGNSEMLSQASASQESTRTCMSLILIDDGDIVFDQDDGFSSAVAQLIHHSKRPVIIVTTSMTCPHLQRFLQCGRILNMHPLLPKMLGTWLDIMCLADNGTCWPGLGARFLDLFRGDIRKTINCLQFYMTSHIEDSEKKEEISAQSNDYYSENIDDETSSMSWERNEDSEKGQLINKMPDNLEYVWKSFTCNDLNFIHLGHPLEVFNIWWSVPSLFKEMFDCGAQPEDTLKSEDKQTSLELQSIANIVDMISVADYFSNIKPDTRSNITSQPWYAPESDGVSESESLENFNRSHEVGDHIIHNLVTGSILDAQQHLQCESRTYVHFPDMAAQRKRDKVVSRHEDLSTYLSPLAVLDRKAIALDYWPSCRDICRIEKSKTDVKRNNRFCHYLKSLSILCKNDAFEKLGDSLCPKGKQVMAK